ncbi:chemotaxis protein CheZ [Enterobacter sp. BIGb0383]|uniref:protein phosphatase CheZ n=1 Tax=unclassified Enterobacter TaxID=2608935 RepID=UPI000F473622|nr:MULTISPECIES: protein phosphatase CheZ [unclassified Enterobacter]ROP58323.1 chemotaxis protein CheZ [Enterobacter sp. BIGb0383]ROS06789.1 chemotaxis protein CheZ [Enterobacter sp. BIGb0359]
MDTLTNTAAADNFKSIFSRIGHLTRQLRTSMSSLGLDRAIMDAAEAIPDTRDRLSYIVSKTSQAADRALTCVESARPLQDRMHQQASHLSGRWDEWFEQPIELPVARDLVSDTRDFLRDVPELCNQTNNELMEIMMAQDFQDLTGQVVQRLMHLIETIEKELIQVLVENVPNMVPDSDRELESLKNGPQIDHTQSGVVATQDQVDDLLADLGF